MTSGSMSYPTFSRLNRHELVFCNTNDWPAGNGMCHVLNLSNTKLSLGKAVMTNSSTYQPVLAQLDTNRAMLCYIDESASCHVVTRPNVAANPSRIRVRRVN